MFDGTEYVIGLGLPGYGEDEIQFMEETLVMVRPEFIADWGTNRGTSARTLRELAIFHGLDAMIVTTDLPLTLTGIDHDHAGGQTAHFLADTRDVKQLWGDGVTEALDIWVGNGKKKAVFFVDGDHSRENVVRELRWIHRVAPDATLLLHDTKGAPGEAIRQFLAENPNTYSVQFCASQAGLTRLVPWPK